MNFIIDPVAFYIGNFGVKWYGLAYFATFIIGVALAKFAIQFQKPANITKKDIDILLNYTVLGVILGGRIGEFLFYRPDKLFSLELFKIRNGGMSFHGGLVGVVLSILIFSYVYKKNKYQISDLITLCVPIGSLLGRIANYINQEIVGTSTTLFLPYVERHPVVLYEAFFEGLVLFFILFRRKNIETTGYITSMFLFFYGLFRFILEEFRVPDGMIGCFSTAQILSLIMMIAGYIVYSNNIKSKR